MSTRMMKNKQNGSRVRFPTASNGDLWPWNWYRMRVASKAGNLPSKFGHDRPLRSGIIRYVSKGRTDRQTDGQKQRLLALPDSRGTITQRYYSYSII